ncbi:hypothetical protein DVH24_024765 [Malus domestica]|uniref:TOG domain-containing protein n=1 Tax=Malus domestica TaxID=3750 RepID=A0A498JP21_MALDO|nr:hypothetical protein DVH24_024765 [Malus domestica]
MCLPFVLGGQLTWLIFPCFPCNILVECIIFDSVAAISSFKQQVEGLQDIDHSIEMLVGLLCAVPVWSEKKCSDIRIGAWFAFCLSSGISERVADIKTRTHAMKCLTAFSEAIGPGLIFERLYKIMKEHKNSKVLSEGVLWMVSAVEDFGVAHVKLKELIDFCKETGLQSSAAATRNSTIKLLGAIHKFGGPGCFCGSQEKCWDNGIYLICLLIVAIQFLDNLFIVWLPAELFAALRGRLYDSKLATKNLVAATLTVVGNVASAIGAPAEMLSKAPCITAAISDTKLGAEGWKDLFEWLTRQISGLSDFSDAAHLLKPASSALTDKSSDVRKAAETCVSEILRVSGHETVKRARQRVVKILRDIHGPTLALVERLKPHGSFHLWCFCLTIPTKGSNSMLSVQDIAVQSQALINVKDSVKNDMTKCFREDVHGRLLSTDFKKQVDGLEILHKALPTIKKEIIQALDILLRWFVLQFCLSFMSYLKNHVNIQKIIQIPKSYHRWIKFSVSLLHLKVNKNAESTAPYLKRCLPTVTSHSYTCCEHA